jgi:hypothetical protein
MQRPFCITDGGSPSEGGFQDQPSKYPALRGGMSSQVVNGPGTFEREERPRSRSLIIRTLGLRQRIQHSPRRASHFYTHLFRPRYSGGIQRMERRRSARSAPGHREHVGS